MRWVLVDEKDGNFSDNYADTFKIYGIGKVGTTTRVYSVQMNAGGEGIDALKTAMHSAGGISLGGSTYVIGGTISTNGNLVSSSYLIGGFGSEVAGTGGTLAPTKPMPPAGVFDTYKNRATVIASSTASDGTLTPGVLSATYSPYGTPNADGIYYLRLPDAISKLTVQGRFKATLVVEGSTTNGNQTLEIDSPVFWEPASYSFPALICKGVKTLRIKGQTASYDSTYSSEMRGLIHAIGTSSVALEDKAFIRGCLIADGTISTVALGTVGLTAMPSLWTTPPTGYTKGNRVTPNPGTWKWDTLPAGVN
jgi:hypothetical protein